MMSITMNTWRGLAVRKILLDDRGKPVCEYMDQDGTVWIGEYDLVPILDRFVEEHPDLATEGQGNLGLTGYIGVLGYHR